MLWSGPGLKPRSSGSRAQAYSGGVPLSSSSPTDLPLADLSPRILGHCLRLVGIRQCPPLPRHHPALSMEGIGLVCDVFWVLPAICCVSCLWTNATLHLAWAKMPIWGDQYSCQNKSTALKISYVDEHSKIMSHCDIHYSWTTLVFWTKQICSYFSSVIPSIRTPHP